MIKHTIKHIYITSDIQENVAVSLGKEQTHYLKNVMRMKLSDNIYIFNGKHGLWEGEIVSLAKKSCDILPVKQLKEQLDEPDIWLIFAPVKNVRIDFIAQKATELGVSVLQPVITQNTIVSRVNIDRLRSNAIEASEQCERLTVPPVHEPIKLQNMINSWDTERNIMLCDESGEGGTIANILSSKKRGDKWAILIGPEGGFSQEELATLRKLPYVTSVGLGPRILRADTAAIAALSCWQEHLGDWNIPPRFIK